MALGRQEEGVPKQSLSDQRQQGHAGWENMDSTASPVTGGLFCSHHLRDPLGLSQLGTDTQQGKGQGYRKGRGWGS